MWLNKLVLFSKLMRIRKRSPELTIQSCKIDYHNPLWLMLICKISNIGWLWLNLEYSGIRPQYLKIFIRIPGYFSLQMWYKILYWLVSIIRGKKTKTTIVRPGLLVRNVKFNDKSAVLIMDTKYGREKRANFSASD